MIRIQDVKYMKLAADEALKAVKLKEGGPFGAVIVRNDRMIAKAHNTVIKTNDPTSHAEVNAIRKASARLRRFDLSDCELYTSCEPCPMCLGAVLWARIKKVYYGCTKDDARKIGFDDLKFHSSLTNARIGLIKSQQLDRKICLVPFKKWQQDKSKKHY